MALKSQAALLDELMGIDRNSSDKKEITWQDESVCKYFLAGYCPHELFVNTKMTLGECPKYHNDKLLDSYKSDEQYLKMGYERRLKKFLEGYVNDVQKKIDYNVDRLRNGLLSGTEYAIKERIKKHEDEVNYLVEAIEEKANLGKIAESRDLSLKLEELQKDLKYDKIELQRQREFSREKMEDVCKVCGAYISKTDPRNSLENHTTGRIHCSYVKINEIIESLNKLINVSFGGYENDDKTGRRSNSRKITEEIEEEPYKPVIRDRSRSNHSRYSGQMQPERRHRQNHYRRDDFEDDYEYEGYRDRNNYGRNMGQQYPERRHRYQDNYRPDSREEFDYQYMGERSRNDHGRFNRPQSPQQAERRPREHHHKKKPKHDKHRFDLEDGEYI